MGSGVNHCYDTGNLRQYMVWTLLQRHCSQWTVCKVILLVMDVASLPMLENIWPLNISSGKCSPHDAFGDKNRSCRAGCSSCPGPKVKFQTRKLSLIPSSSCQLAQKSTILSYYPHYSFSYPPQQPLHHNCLDSPCPALSPRIASSWGQSVVASSPLWASWYLHVF